MIKCTSEGFKISTIKWKTESKRHRYTQVGRAAMFPYAVISHVRLLSNFQDGPENWACYSHVQRALHKSNSLCYITWKQIYTESCSISSKDMLRYDLSLGPRSQGHSVVCLISPSKARGRTVRSMSDTVKSEVKLSAEVFKAQTSYLFCQDLVTAIKMYFSW